MSQRVVTVAAPSRLHFGMLAVNRAGARQFGGVGAMIATPGLRLTIRAADRLEAIGPLSGRAAEVARRWAGAAGEPRCRIEITAAPHEHVGLGTGTQLSMAVAAGLEALAGRNSPGPVELARRAGRGERSAVGLYGFLQGGLIFEGGKLAAEEISPLIARAEVPGVWRFVLLAPRGAAGLSGEAERRAFATLPAVPCERACALERLARDALLPAAAAADFDAFSEALYEFGYEAGLTFAREQGGAFAGPRLTALVARVRELGIRGVGQSSWGPTVFALCPDETAAQRFLERIRQTADDDLDTQITAPDNRGVRIDVRECQASPRGCE